MIIKLTRSWRSVTPYYVNINDISAFYTKEYEGNHKTELSLRSRYEGGSSVVNIMETPEEIMQIISEALYPSTDFTAKFYEPNK